MQLLLTNKQRQRDASSRILITRGSCLSKLLQALLADKDPLSNVRNGSPSTFSSSNENSRGSPTALLALSVLAKLSAEAERKKDREKNTKWEKGEQRCDTETDMKKWGRINLI